MPAEVDEGGEGASDQQCDDNSHPDTGGRELHQHRPERVERGEKAEDRDTAKHGSDPECLPVDEEKCRRRDERRGENQHIDVHESPFQECR